jgi:EAL domain-containing protein (putative c-di-GMP-specific phosphodiesterase class I)
VNLPAIGWVNARWARIDRPGPGGTGASTTAIRPAGPALALVLVALGTTAIGVLLAWANPGGCRRLLEDLVYVLVPAGGALAVMMTVSRGDPASRAIRRPLALSLGLCALGQLAAAIADVLPVEFTSVFRAACVGLAASGLVVAVAVLRRSVYTRLEGATRLESFLDGLVVMAATLTFVLSTWLDHVDLPRGQEAGRLWDSSPQLFVTFGSAFLIATVATVALGALALRVRPDLRGLWAALIGVVLIDLAWNGPVASVPLDSSGFFEHLSLLFPVGALLIAYGGVTWTLQPGGGPGYDRVAQAISDWLPIAAIIGCAVLVVLPHARPLDIDPTAMGTCLVVLLAVARLRMLQGRERIAYQRLTAQISERAAATVSLARLEAAATIEETAGRICAEGLRLAGIDTVALFAFSSAGVVSIAQAGATTRPLAIGDVLPPDAGRELCEHAEFGPWLETWTGQTPRDDFERAMIESGLQAEALAPLIWNDERIGLLAMGATSGPNAHDLWDRLATVTEFSVMSGAILGPMLSERRQHDQTRAEVQSVIDAQAFTPVFQPIVNLATRKSVGYEALTRFSDGARPDLRFLAADKVGMMVPLEMATLNLQVEQARRLPKGSFVSLNVSPALATRLMPLLDVVAAADRAVVVEITEHAEIDDYSLLVAALEQVRPHAMLAVDDAGAGYAGLHHILELRPHFVKLDISLVRNIDSDPARQAMVSSMTRFARSVRCALIAEGIETESELEALKLLKVEYGQGYFLAKPAPIGVWAQAAVEATPVTQVTRKPRRSRKAP